MIDSFGMSRRLRIIGLVVGVLIVGAAGVVMVVQPWGSAAEPAVGTPAVEQQPPFSEPEAQRLEVALGSGDPVQVAAAVVLPEDSRVDPTFVKQLAGMKIDIDSETFTAQDETNAIVDATAGGRPWVLLLQRGGDLGWRLLGTVDVS